MGLPGGAVGNAFSKNGTYSYNENLKGTGASTTGNIYGIYDMVGGVHEYVMGNYNGYSGFNATTNSGFKGPTGDASAATDGISFPSKKYYDLYTTLNANTASGGICYAHSMAETSKYYNDNNLMAASSSPWVSRGAIGSYYDVISSGVFFYDSNYGIGNGEQGFRIVLT